jgi:hypothetical protein
MVMLLKSGTIELATEKSWSDVVSPGVTIVPIAPKNTAFS